jgi:hypothetical protein
MHGLLGVELPLEEVGDLHQVSQVELWKVITNRFFGIKIMIL